jgi:Tol biopolymer transport system component
LRQRLWPDDTFVDFEHGLNAAVKRLREALADSAENQRFIETLPKRGYRFVAPVVHSDGEADRSGVSHRRGWLAAAGAIVLALAALAVWLRQPAPAAVEPSMQLVPLTTLTGYESGATFSPDGSQVAFAWDGEQQDNSDIYVKLVGSTEVRRLTTDPARDFAPQWSPDGKWIAYARSVSLDEHRIRVMSSLGDSDHELSRSPLLPPVAWSPDGKYLVAGRTSETRGSDGEGVLFLVPVDVGEPRPMTRPESAAQHQMPAISPDGRHLAYASCNEGYFRTNCFVQVLGLDRALTPTGPPRRLTHQTGWTITGLTWSRDGRFVVFSAGMSHDFSRLWRVAADGKDPPARIEVAGIQAIEPTIAAGASRLAFSKQLDDMDLHRLEAGGEARPIARSSAREFGPAFSPDGRRIAFCSVRTGDAIEIWVAGSDGSNPVRLTRGPGSWQGSPAWSPDGRRIAFDSRAEDGSVHVWTIDAEGGTPQPITSDQGNQIRPAWSNDGEWIYFFWIRGTDHDIWRTRGPGQPPQRVTFNGAFGAVVESADGTGVFHKRHMTGPLLFQPLSGGAPREVGPCVSGTRFSIGQHGIYYVPCTDDRVLRDIPVHVMNPATGEDRPYTTIKNLPFPASWPTAGSFAASRDGRTIVYSTYVSRGADLMLIENFR